MRKNIGIFLCLLAGFFCCFAISAGEIRLAADGKTDYQIISPKNPSQLEKDAVKDFRSIMKKISGADFSRGKNKSRSIFIGVVPPTDKKPLAEDERRITTYKGNIYIYGEGKRGTTNAIYDFLRTYLNCRWYTPCGDERIPEQKNITFKELKYSFVPAFPTPMTASRVYINKKARDFARRNNLADRDEYNTGGAMGSHAGHAVIPSGLIPYGEKRQNLPGPYKCLKDKAYFKDHPEFFTLDYSGKRNPWRHLCYSNKEMRDEFAKNIVIILNDMKYKSGMLFFSIGQDDKGGKFCHCSSCIALEKRYKHPAGAYYDFLYDIARRFEKRYPDLKFLFLAYRDDQTLFPSEKMTKLPRNLVPSYAPLGIDFSKPLSHPNNKTEYDTFKRWAKVAPLIYWWSYPTPYPRPQIGFPLIANVSRIVENFRFAHQNNVWMVYSQYGGGVYVNFALNDMRRYLLQELCRDINLDYRAVMKEFYEATVGEAAPLMLEFISELEKEEKNTTLYLTWNSDILRPDYLTAENLLRWTKLFNRMEKLAGDNPRHFLNVRRARFFLDESIIARWHYMKDAEKRRFGSVKRIIARVDRTIRMDVADLWAGEKISKSEKRSKIRHRVRFFRNGLEAYAAAALGGKELPPELKSRGKLYRIISNRNRHQLIKDENAAFGLCNTGKIPGKNQLWLGVRTFVPGRNPAWKTTDMPKPITMKRLEKESLADGKYHYVHLGASALSRICVMNVANIYGQSWFELTPLFDPERPARLFDFYVQIAVDKDKKEVRLGELVAIPLDKDADKKNMKEEAVEDNIDPFA